MSVLRALFGRRRNEPEQGGEARESDPNLSSSPGVEGERSIASINRAMSIQARVTNVLAIGLMAVLGLGFLGWYYTNAFARRSQTDEQTRASARRKLRSEMPLQALGPIEPPLLESTADLEQLLGPPPEAPPARMGRTTRTRGTGARPTPAQTALERQLSGAVFSIGMHRADSGGAERGQPSSLAGDSEFRTSTGSDLAKLLTPTVTSAVLAQVLPTQRLLLPKGAFLDCTLETAVDSSLPGMTTCVTATDTFGADGTIVLLERGTKLVGETRGDVRQGSSRLFVLWTEARTPTGVVIALASPGTDELGRAGLEGEVNRHFWQRFGAAILISVIDGAVQAALRGSNDGGDAVIINPSSTEQIMTEVLRSTINIPPTVTKRNGDRIQVLVARDLDFRSVYELRPATAQ